MPAWADGRAWRAHRFDIPITRNVVTPYYYGYYGSHYSYVAPDPVPGPTYVRYEYVVPACWLWIPGQRYRVC
jgi:hypothetical protein